MLTLFVIIEHDELRLGLHNAQAVMEHDSNRDNRGIYE